MDVIELLFFRIYAILSSHCFYYSFLIFLERSSVFSTGWIMVTFNKWKVYVVMLLLPCLVSIIRSVMSSTELQKISGTAFGAGLYNLQDKCIRRNPNEHECLRMILFSLISGALYGAGLYSDAHEASTVQEI